ncbi:MAG: hypothetical protein WDZ80_02495, partial [Candidatus Paceibacterota bacterium]
WTILPPLLTPSFSTGINRIFPKGCLRHRIFRIFLEAIPEGLYVNSPVLQGGVNKVPKRKPPPGG